MRSQLDDLRITDREVERLTGCDVGSIFIGGVFGGVYRLSVFRNPQRLIAFCLTQAVVFLLIVMFTFPLSLVAIGKSTVGVSELSGSVQILSITVGIALLVMVFWNGYMWVHGKRFRVLMPLLDELDRYHEVLGAIAVLDQLEAVGTPSHWANRADVLEALRVTRDSLVAGLMTEKILRDSRGLLARRQELIASIEINLATLQSLEVKDRATEYGQFLSEALEIGTSIHHAVRNLSK